MIDLRHGDCRSVLRDLPDASVHCCVTDPPYGLEFMGKKWDSFGRAPTGGANFTPDGMGKNFKALPSFTGTPNPTCRNCRGTQRGNDRPGFTRCRCASPDFPNTKLNQMRAYGDWCEEWACEVLRVLKPGGHLVAFGGTRTSHRMACAIEDAGFEIRDTLCWLYGSGFPKSHDVSKAIDRAAGVEREVIGSYPVTREFRGRDYVGDTSHAASCDITAPATPDAQRWQGWGTALKLAHEPIILARKPLQGTVAANVLAHGTGAINVDACRVACAPNDYTEGGSNDLTGTGWGHKDASRTQQHSAGRWPANVLHDGSPEVEAAFAAFGERASCNSPSDARAAGLILGGTRSQGAIYPGDTGSASRFFYSAKATAADRADSRHPTVKPVELMRWLVRLVTPPGGTVLDPFAGSGTTGEAAMLCGFDAVLIEQDAQHVADIRHRMDRWSGEDAPLFASPPPAEDPEEARQMALFMEPEYGA